MTTTFDVECSHGQSVLPAGGSTPKPPSPPPASFFHESCCQQVREALTGARNVGCVVARPPGYGALLRVSGIRQKDWSWTYRVVEIGRLGGESVTLIEGDSDVAGEFLLALFKREYTQASEMMLKASEMKREAAQ